MPSLSRSLEQALHRAIKLASDRHHEYATLEHLLLALMDDQDAAQVMKACNVDTDALRKAVQKYVDEELMTLVIEDGEDAKPTTGFQRVVQRAVLHVHRHGVGICGVFTYEVAETKVAQVIEFARRHQHPLQCTMEKE